MQYSVVGTSCQSVVVQMISGDEVKSEIENLIFLSDGVTLEASSTGKLRDPKTSVSLTYFRCVGQVGLVTFASPCIGLAREIKVQKTGWYCTREAFLFCTRDINVTVGLSQSINNRFYTENDYVLYLLQGYGDLYIYGGGHIVEYELVEKQRVTIEIGCVVAFQDCVKYEVEYLDGLSTRTTDESIAMLTLTGPGRIYIATHPFSRLGQNLPQMQMPAPPIPHVVETPQNTMHPAARQMLREL